MSPLLALVIVGVGWIVLARPSWLGVSGVGARGCQPIDAASINALIVHNQRPTPAQSAAAGAAAGASLAAMTWGASIGVGAAAGYLTRSRSNDTLADRRTFASALGFASLDQLFQALDRLGRHDLSQQALNVIGRQDHVANEQWQRDVLAVLLGSGFCL